MNRVIVCVVVLLMAGQGCGDAPAPAAQTVPAQALPVEMMTKSDCFSCHFVEDRSFGPSYLKIATRYQTRDVDTRKLRTKIQEGGGGLWGSAQMSRHPFLKDADVDAMVEWVLSLADQEAALNATYADAEPIAWSEEGRGLSIQLYEDPAGDYPNDSTRLFVAGARFTGAVPTFWVKGETAQMHSALPAVVVAEGTLHIKTAGKYFFRLRGKKVGCLYVGGTQVISILEGDRENLVELKAGKHALRIEARLIQPADRVMLEWIAPGETYYSLLPADQL